MTPAAAIGLLDRAIARDGETITLSRNVPAGQPAVAPQSPRAFLRGYRPEELTDQIQTNDSMAILSPTGLAWMPQRLDDALVAGRKRKVQNVDGIKVGDAVVRYEVQIR